jgi:hypothetical protein
LCKGRDVTAVRKRELNRFLEPPFHNARCTDPIQFLAKHLQPFGARAKFAKLRKCQRCWLSECLDLNVNEHTDFVLDGSGWGCHHGNLNDILAERVRSQPALLSPFLWKRRAFNESRWRDAKTPPAGSVIQINTNGEELRPEEAHCLRVPCAAGQLTRQPALALNGIIVGEQMSSARVPSSSKSVTQFQSYTRITLDVADVSCLHAVLRHQPELLGDPSVAHWRAAWLSGLATDGFEERVPRQRQTNGERELNW